MKSSLSEANSFLDKDRVLKYAVAKIIEQPENLYKDNPEKLSEIENIVAIKEASGNLSQVAEIAHLCGDNLNIYSGNDDQIVPILSIGGLGVISVLSNLMPKYTHEMTEAYFSGNITKACKMQVDAIPLIKSLFCEVNPIPVKAACNLMNLGGGIPRLPLIEMSESNKELLKNEMKKMNLL